MRVINEVLIKDYRGLKELTFEAADVNIIVGRNNTGKSSILEAIGLGLSSFNNFEDTLKTNLLDYLINDKKIKNIRHLVNLDADRAKIELEMKGNKKLTLEIYPFKALKDLEDKPKLYEWFITFLNNYARNKALSTLDGSLLRYISYSSKNKKKKDTLRQTLLELFLSGSVDVRNERIFDDTRVLLKKIVEQKEDEITRAFLKTLKLIFVTKINDVEKIVNLINVGRTIEDMLYFDMFHEGRYSLYSINVLYKSFKRLPKILKKSIIFNFHKVGYDNQFLKIYKAVASNPDLLSSALEMIKNRIPYFEDIRQIGDEIFVYVHENKTRVIPLQLMGDGFINLIRLALLTALARDGIILLEEPEISLHPGFIDILADAIMTFSNYTQFFISTHSAELIQAILEKGKEKNELNKINVIRLFKHEDLVDREILPGNEALDEIETIETDLRGY